MGERCIKFLDDLTDRVLVTLLRITLLCSVLLCMQTVRIYRSAAGGSPDHERVPPADSESTDHKGDSVMRLVIDGTPVDFPVMQGSDNTEYLTKDPAGEYSVCGSVFLDCRNSYDLSDPYNLMYGHHMSGQYMFGALDRFMDASYLLKHNTGTVRTCGHVYALHVFCCMKSDAYDAAVYDPDQFDREAFLQYAKAHAYAYEEPGEGRILVLSTCESDSLTGRTVVAAVIAEAAQPLQTAEDFTGIPSPPGL